MEEVKTTYGYTFFNKKGIIVIIDSFPRTNEKLSPTRLMITWLLLKGILRKEIASLLEITEATVAEHIHEVFQHFRVSSSIELLLKINK